jgi:hypothetical protein
MWFYNLTGFHERTPDDVRSNLLLDGEKLTSRVNGRAMGCGRLEIPSLAELRERVQGCPRGRGLQVSVLRSDVRRLHCDPANSGSTFQVASQFNLLEMPGPHVVPEEGVDGYERDWTQGPACAISAGAGTIYRNYFVPVDGKLGQSTENQIDCLADLGVAFGNTGGRLWEMTNGYALATRDGLIEISNRLVPIDQFSKDRFRSLLRIGLHWDVQVTENDCEHRVTQCFCSALPVSYSGHPKSMWESFARLVLEAAYEATICAAAINAATTGSKRLYLTLLGGGAFGNPLEWIVDAAERALELHANLDLEVVFVSFSSVPSQVEDLVARFSPRR